jgi:hypothetical protein
MKISLFAGGLLALFLSSCGVKPAQDRPQDGMEIPRARLSGEERLARLEAVLQEADTVPIRTVAKVTYAPKSGKTIALRADIRTLPDSVFWVDLSDAVLGIKVARALLTKDTALAYSRLQNMWLAESPERLIAYAGLPLTFELLMDLWTAQPALNGYTCNCAEGPVHFDDAGTGPTWKFRFAEGAGSVALTAFPNDRWALMSQQVTTTADTYSATYDPGKSLKIEWSGGQVLFEIQEQSRTAVTFPFQIPPDLERVRL